MKKIIFWLFIFWSISTINAANFYISPEYKELTSKCEASVDIMIDSEWKEVAAADMVLVFNTGQITPLCFIPWDYLNIWWWMAVDWDKIKVTSYNYPWYAKWKWKFWTLIFRPFSSTRETTLYFDVKKLWLGATAWDSNISRPWWWDLLDKAWFAKYTFTDWECKKIDESLLKNCKIYDNSWSITTFVKKYEKEVKSESITYARIIIRSILLIIIFIAIIRKFIIKPQDIEWKN